MSEGVPFLRVRLYLNSKQPCFRHLQGKTDQEVRAWAEMALNYVGALLDSSSNVVEGSPRLMSESIDRVQEQIPPVSINGGEPAVAVSTTKLTKKLPGTGTFVQNARTGWSN